MSKPRNLKHLSRSHRCHVYVAIFPREEVWRTALIIIPANTPLLRRRDLSICIKYAVDFGT